LSEFHSTLRAYVHLDNVTGRTTVTVDTNASGRHPEPP